ncbi:hypothetical protein ACLKA6_000447 [Drosophila palustris]
MQYPSSTVPRVVHQCSDLNKVILEPLALALPAGSNLILEALEILRRQKELQKPAFEFRPSHPSARWSKTNEPLYPRISRWLHEACGRGRCHTIWPVPPKVLQALEDPGWLFSVDEPTSGWSPPAL